MADTDVLVSELDSASAINTNDLLLMTQPDGDAETGYASRKGTVLQTATKMLKGIEFTTDLPHFTDKTVLGALEELSTGKANTSGEYNGLISGQANALKPSARLENSTPYLFRPSFSNGYGYETLIGGTCGVNQLSSGYYVGTHNNIVISESDNKCSIVGTVSPAFPYDLCSISSPIEFIRDGRKYLILVNTKTLGNHNWAVMGYAIHALHNGGFMFSNNDGGTWTNSIAVQLAENEVVNDECYISVIDLTAYFGSTIADYVYTLESGTSGAGITWLKNNGFFTADYYPYNAGGLLSVKTSKKINRDADNNVIGEYTLDDIELRGILKLDGNNNLYYDGDTYSSSGEVVRKYEYRAYASGDESLPDTITDGTYTVTKLVTPTTETADPFTNPMIVDGNGTEQFVDGRTVEMPVGHSTIYVDDNDATKLGNLPDISNDGNGTYLVTQSNGQMSLDKYPIPNPPTTDGSYRLEVTVTDGVPAYTWEVIS